MMIESEVNTVLKKKMLITGATGFLGSRIAQYYKDKYEVLTPSHGEMNIAEEASVRAYFIDNRPDVVIHCAAISDVGRCEREPEFSWSINVGGTENVVRAAKTVSAKCVCCSSDQVYFGSTETEAHSENEGIEPANMYGKEKLYAENACLEIDESSVHLRLSWMYDAEDKKRMDFIKQLRACMYERKEIAFSAKDKRGITDVWEVVKNMELALDLPGGIYNFGSPNNKSTYEMVMDVCQALGCDSAYVKEMENANFRNLTMEQGKVNIYGIFFATTQEGVLRSLRDCV